MYMHLIQLYNFIVFFSNMCTMYNFRTRGKYLSIYFYLSLSLSLSRACVHIYPSSYLF